MTRFLLMLSILFITALFAGCGSNKASLGESCQWQGSSFTARHNCSFGAFCLAHVDCDQSRVPLSRCVQRCKSNADCPGAASCYRYSESNRFCVAKSVCLNQ